MQDPRTATTPHNTLIFNDLNKKSIVLSSLSNNTNKHPQLEPVFQLRLQSPIICLCVNKTLAYIHL